MLKLFSSFVFYFCFLLGIHAQTDIFNDLKKSQPGWGKINLQQDPKLELWVEKHRDINQKAKGFPGYRVQVYFGSGSDAKGTANKLRSDLNNQYTDWSSYLSYEAPYFKVRIGDFRNRNEAYKAFKIIQGNYPGAFIVEDLISLPPL